MMKMGQAMGLSPGETEPYAIKWFEEFEAAVTAAYVERNKEIDQCPAQ
jgi:hypothetical protein